MRENPVGTKTRRWIPVFLSFAASFLADEVYSSFAGDFEWRPVLASLYYIPTVIAAITLGIRPALVVAVAAAGSHALTAEWARPHSWVEPLAQTVLFICIALTAARLAKWRAGDLHPVEEKPEGALAFGIDEKNGGQTLSRAVVGLVRQFRTPVTAIEGAGWVLDDPYLPDNKRRELVGIVRKEAHRLTRVLSDVLDFTQPRQPRFGTANLSMLVDDVIRLASPKDRKHSYVFKTDIASEVPALRADPEQMRQVLLNLVMNSIQAMPAGGQIEISAGFEDDKFTIAVQDQGQGIPPAEIDRIFDPFFTTHEHNLGLGLPTVLRIVTQHGGRIAVDCKRSKGTCISIMLPAARPPQVGPHQVR